MRGMILAAGRGQRMGGLTEQIPKPLLRVKNRYLIEYSIDSLTNIGVQDIVINVAYRGDQIKEALGDGSRYGARFYFSEEEQALETGGGILQALPLLGHQPFITLSCDVICDFALQNLPREPRGLAHLVVVENPLYHPRGDFCLRDDMLYLAEQNQFTFSNIGIYRPELFAGCQPGKFRLGDLLKQAILDGRVSGEVYHGNWHNVGTPMDLEGVNS